VLLLLLSGFSCSLPRGDANPSGAEATLSSLQTLAAGLPTRTPTQWVGTPVPGASVTFTLPRTPTLALTLFHPTFSGEPPGGSIVFTCSIDGFDQVCLMDSDGSDLVRLTDAPATEFYASLSPDGQQVLFSSRRDGAFQIYTLDRDGSDLVRLTNGLGNLYAPEVSPDGAQIVFTVETGGRQNIWVMERDGSDPHALTDTAGNGDPTWSPDGTRIAFVSSRTGVNQLWVMDRDGSDPRQVTDLPNMGGRSSWSPDGTRLAFYAGPVTAHQVYTIGVGGNDLWQLTDTGDNLGPCFSPDGEWITFTSFRDWNNEIYIMRRDGTMQTRLTYDLRADWQPRWGP
jgi:Tol biopolymer transport system component